MTTVEETVKPTPELLYLLCGDPVELSVTLTRCTGKVSGTVAFSPGGAHGGGMPVAPGDPDNLTVGTFTTEIR